MIVLEAALPGLQGMKPTGFSVAALPVPHK